MKTLSASLPSGLSPEPTPAPAGPAPAPGEQSAPGMCELCRQGHMLFEGSHYCVCEKGVIPLGRCVAPPKTEAKVEAKPLPARRTHEETMARIHAMASEQSAAEVLAVARRTFVEQSQPEEDDDD